MMTDEQVRILLASSVTRGVLTQAEVATLLADMRAGRIGADALPLAPDAVIEGTNIAELAQRIQAA
jgi:hypothetical protein